MEKIVFFNTKGGTGKTTICYNFGWYLAEKKNKKILFMDFDPQINLVQAFNSGPTKNKKNLDNLLIDHLKRRKINFRDYIIKINDNIDLLPASNNISLIEECLTDYLLKKSLKEKKYNINIRTAGIVINAFEKRSKLPEQMVDILYEKYGKSFTIFNQKIRYLVHYQKSISLKKEPVFISFPNTEASKDIIKLFSQIEKKINSIN